MLFDFGRDAVQHVIDLVKKYEIDCDFFQAGIAFTANSKRHLGIVKNMENAAKLGGIDYAIWDQEKCFQNLGIPFKGAYFDGQGCNMNPYKLARGILEKVISKSKNVQVLEETTVENIKYGETIEANGNNLGGKFNIKAKNVLIATNSYTQWKPYDTFYAPIHVFTVITEPLTKEQLNHLNDWPQIRTGWYSLHHILWACRLTPDNRIAIATGDVYYFSGDKLHMSDDRYYGKLTRALKVFFPKLDLKVADRWEGVIAITLSDFPCVGMLNEKLTNVFFSLAYCGHGVSISNYSGVIIADLYLKQRASKYLTSDYYFIGVKYRPFPRVPKGILRDIISQGYIGLLKELDYMDNKEMGWNLEEPYFNHTYLVISFSISLLLIVLLIGSLF